MRRLLIVVLIATLCLGIGLVARDWSGTYSEFCTLEGLLVDAPEGWSLARDHYNDCAWTLFNESGERASAELYVGLPVEPPPDYPRTWDGLGWVLISASLVGLAMTLRSSRPVPERTQAKASPD